MAYLIDTTLREGAQAPGVCFDLGLKQNIAKGLVVIGVDEVELGLVVVGDGELAEFSRWFQASYPKQSFSLWSRCCVADIYCAKSLNPTVLSLSIPVSDLHLTIKMAKNREWARKTLRESIRFAFFLGMTQVAVGFEDATRADPLFLREMAEIAQQEGAFRVRLADTAGVASPRSMATMLEVVADMDLQLGVHCHNDFGMATANTIASLEYGAQWADVTILGLGERAGNCRLEEVVSFLSLQKHASRYDVLAMCRLSREVSRGIDRPIPATRAILGHDIFTCETGLHLQGLMVNPATYEPYEPHLVGATRRLLIGQKVGSHAIGKTLQRLGIATSDSAILNQLTKRIRAVARDRNRPLVDHEIMGIIQSDRCDLQIV